MSQIIFLNGCGSSGKTSIARAIQHLSIKPWLTFGVDTFIAMAASRHLSEYVRFVPGNNERGQTMRVDNGPQANQLFGQMPAFARLMADGGSNLIIDEVLLDDVILQKYLMALKDHTIYFVGVFCALPTMEERKVLRGDRAIGLSNDQIDRVHQGLRNYDLTVDTTHLSSFGAARQILAFIERKPQTS